MGKTVCFTGSRHLSDSETASVRENLRALLPRLCEAGYTVFRTGGAWGFDTVAAEEILALRDVSGEKIRLELILPYPDQTEGWSTENIRRYRSVLGKADAVRYTSGFYFDGVLQLRNRQLVDGADYCVAYLRSSHGGGTAYTVAYALKSGLDFCNLAE